MSTKNTVEKDDPREIFTLSGGVRVRFTPVNTMTVQRAQDSIPLPAVYEQAEKLSNGQVRMAQNPNHPDYKEKVKEADKERSLKALETMVLFGVDLVDPLPADDEWLHDLGMVLDIQKYYVDREDGTRTISKKARTMLYIIHVGAKNPSDYSVITSHTMVTETAVQEQVKSF